MIHQITDRERELAAENELLKAELGDLPEAQHEMLAEIKALRKSRDAYQVAADDLATENKVLRDQIEQIRLANLDCIAWFDVLKADYYKLREAARLGLDALDYDYSSTHKEWDRRRVDTIAALKEALGEK